MRELTPRLLRYCRGRTGEEALAEDIAQEALIALVTRWRRLGPPQSPVAFVFAIARRRAGRRLAKRRLRELFVRSQNGRRPAPSVAQELSGRDRLARTFGAISRLRRADREALLLVAAAELNLRDGAAVLGVSVPALKMRLHRARLRLRESLNGGEVE